MRKYLLISLFLLTPSLASADNAAPTALWVQLVPDGGNEVRAVISDNELCPTLFADRVSIPMKVRAAANGNFPEICSAVVPAGAKSVSIHRVEERGDLKSATSDQTLPVPAADPQRIMVFGDTGCRIKGAFVQDCNDPAKWPFPEIAATAAKLKPDLVIHVGDYLYRESACPKGNAGCEGTPYGDNWVTWAADFFTPAAPLLAAAPWVFVRGNHEDCERAGPGWLRLMGPQPFNPVAGCISHLPLYTIPLGDMNLAILDDTDAPETTIDADVRSEYDADFGQLANLKEPLWLVTHRPIWGAVTMFGTGMGGNRTLIASLPDPHVLEPVSLMLAGHIHSFEALNYEDKKLPPQLIAGFGGDALDAAPADLGGLNLSGTRVHDGLSIGGFGFLIMTREPGGWRIDIHKVDGSIEQVCQFAKRRLDCPKT